MVWHPATGLGLSSPRATSATRRVRPVAVGQLARARARGRRRRRRSAAARCRGSRARRRSWSGCSRRWDDAVADAWFAMNMDLDEPRERRREAVEAAVGAGRRPVPRRRRAPAESGLGRPPALVAARRARLAPMRALASARSRCRSIQALAVTAVVEPSRGARRSRGGARRARRGRRVARGPGSRAGRGPGGRRARPGGRRRLARRRRAGRARGGRRDDDRDLGARRAGSGHARSASGRARLASRWTRHRVS